MTEAQLRKQAYNMRDYDLHGDKRREYARQYYYRNRDAVLAQKRAKRESA